MRIERIDENKIKIMLSRDDVRAWNVDLKNFTDNTPEAQELFWFALKRAEQDTDFNVGKAQLLVEAMPLSNDGFAMIISKLENEAELAAALIRTGKRVKAAEFRINRKTKATPLIRLFRFSSFEALCRAVVEVSELYLGESRVVKYRDNYYLELTPKDTIGLFEVENILSEFSQKIKKGYVMQGVLNEHGTIMIDADAIMVICENFAD